MIPYRSIEQTEGIRTPLAPEMVNALELWYRMYRDQAPWKKPGVVKSLNLASMIAGEIARQVVLEMKWRIEATDPGRAPGGEARARYLSAEFGKLMEVLRQKLEQGCAAGGMIVKPWPNPLDGHIYFDFAMDWGICPLAFDDGGGLSDVIIPDVFREGESIYTRLERHRLEGEDVVITQRAFKSNRENALGVEVPLSAVPRWAGLKRSARITGAGGALFGWYRTAAANHVDAGCPLGSSVYARAAEVIREADMQYSRLLWEYEGGELAVDVDPTALMPRTDGAGNALPRLNERLFRAVDTGAEETYRVFAPELRDGSLVNGLNQLLMRIEDLCGLSRGTLSEAGAEARTATELRILRQRSYATVADNQRALEKCLRDVIRAMDVYATAYGLAPEGAFAVSFEWDDSILTDVGQQLQERLMLLESGVLGRVELRQWYLGETEAQARAAVAKIREENARASDGSDDDLFPQG
ncbi:MAG: phage portal protein [Clostridia bacterium]|nr:phage portal protein [Clostridia bacterium]